MKRIKKILLILTKALCLSNLAYSYEDYYEKVYTVKISKSEIYRAVNATEKQKKKLSKIFDKYQKRANGIEDSLKRFDSKKGDLGKIERDRYNEIAEVLSMEQLLEYNSYINGKKIEFEEKNDKIKNLLDGLNLNNNQKSRILRYERNFKREIEKLKVKFLSQEDFSKEYNSLKKIRNEKIRTVLTQEQIKVLDDFNKK